MDFTNGEVLLCFMVLISISFVCQSFHVSPMLCDASLATESCPASLYYVPNTTKTLEETSSIFNVNPDVVIRTIDGFSIGINCSCFSDHTEFSWHTDYTVQPGDTWESVSLKLGSFVVEKPDKVLIPLQTVTLDLLCGCLDSTYFVSYKVQRGDTLFTICSRFQADLYNTARLNKLENVNLIHVGDIIFIPDPGLENLTRLDDEDSGAGKVSKSHTHIIIVGATIGISSVMLLSAILIFWNLYKRKGSQQSMSYSRRRDCVHYYSNGFYNNSKSQQL